MNIEHTRFIDPLIDVGERFLVELQRCRQRYFKEHKRSVEIARDLKKKGLPLPRIAEITRLTLDEIEQL